MPTTLQGRERRTVPLLAESGGDLVAVSSVSGDRGDRGQAAYDATEAALTNLVRSLALDRGDRGVRVDAVAPAFTITDITARVARDERLLRTFTDRVALGRPGQPEDVAPAVLFLASGAAGHVTGAVLAADGGTGASAGPPHL